MLGAIIGDIVGSSYEFCNTYDYNFKLFDSESGFTDDSVMTMAVAYWLLNDKHHRYNTLEKAMVEFAENVPCQMGGYGGGFYYWLFAPKLLQSFNEYPCVKYRSKDGRHPYGSCGNGSAMRVSAVGWFFETLEETERVARISAEITHNHPDGIKGAQVTAAAIWMARNGKTKEEIREYIETKYGYILNDTWEHLHETYTWHSECEGTVIPALVCFMESTDYEDAIRKAVSIGGDSDTIACITGGIAEAFYREIPEIMIKKAQECLPEFCWKIVAQIRNY